jgi:hypothetical protein
VVVVEGGHLAVDLDRAADELDGARSISDLMGDQSEQMQRVVVVGALLQHPPVDRFRLC